MSDRRPAATIPELDVHLGYVQQAIGDLQRVVAGMATKQDITDLAARMDTFATKEELDRLRKSIDDETTVSKLSRWGAIATSVMAIFGVCVALWAGVAYIVRTQDAIHSKP
jgi:hypothetical protein